MKKHPAVIAGVVCAAIMLAGCATPTSGQAPSAPPTSTAATTSTTLWKVDAQLVGNPTIVGDTIVSLLRDDQKLRVGAWNLTDGKRLWSAPAATSGEAPGIELGVETVTVANKAFVAYVRPHKSSGWFELVVADTRTGRTNKRKPIVIWPSTHPGACSDGKAFCLVGYRLSNWTKEVNLRINPLSGKVGIDHTDGLPPNTRWLGYSMYSSDARPPRGVEHLGWAKDGKSVWSRPYTSVFGEAYSSDFGWQWDEERDGVSAGVGYKETCHSSETNGEKTRTCEFTTGNLVGLNSATGASIWSLDRVAGCHGRSDVIMSTESEIATCRNLVDSHVYREDGEDWKLLTSTNEQELVTVNRQTGAVTWRVPLGTTADPTTSPVFVDSEDRIVLTAAGQPAIYDLANHSSTPVSSETRLMCRRGRPTLKLPWLDSNKRYKFSIGEDVEPCDLTGKSVDSIPADWVPDAGFDAGDGRWLLPTPGSLTLVQLS